MQGCLAILIDSADAKSGAAERGVVGMTRRHFGSVRKLPSDHFQATYFHLGLRHRAPKTFNTKAEALRYLATVEIDIHRGGWIDPLEGAMTFKDLAEQWLGSVPSKSATSLMRDRSILELHVLPSIGKLTISEVGPFDVQQMISAWSASGLAPRSVKRQYAIVKAIFSYAVRLDLLVKSPCRSINLPRIVDVPRAPLSTDDVHRLAEAVGERSQLMVYLAAVLGLRWGEVAGLRRHRIDLIDRSILVCEQAVKTIGGGVELGPPKSQAGNRRIAISADLVELIDQHLERFEVQADGLLFTSELGGMVNPSNFRQRVWLPARKIAGLPTVGFHDLRRANATALVTSGVDVKTAQTRLGHADSRMTLEVYAKSTNEADRRAADLMAGHFLEGRSRTDRARNGGFGGVFTPEPLQTLEPERGFEPLTYAQRVRPSSIPARYRVNFFATCYDRRDLHLERYVPDYRRSIRLAIGFEVLAGVVCITNFFTVSNGGKHPPFSTAAPMFAAAAMAFSLLAMLGLRGAIAWRATLASPPETD